MNKHLIPRHTEKNEHAKDGRKKSGTTVFAGFITAQYVSGKIRATVAGYPIANKEPQVHYLGGLIENARRVGVIIKIMLLDRRFNSVARAYQRWRS